MQTLSRKCGIPGCRKPAVPHGQFCEDHGGRLIPQPQPDAIDIPVAPIEYEVAPLPQIIAVLGEPPAAFKRFLDEWKALNRLAMTRPKVGRA